MSFVNEVLSDIFFLSVIALMCFVLDHLLCPAYNDVVVPNDRKHNEHMGTIGVRDAIVRRDPAESENGLTGDAIITYKLQKKRSNERRKLIVDSI